MMNGKANKKIENKYNIEINDIDISIEIKQ